MGWNSWNAFGACIDEQIMRQTADALVATGLKDLGYTYVVLDDDWHGGRDAQGYLYPHSDRFPSGIKALSDYIHSLGLKFGIYACAGTLTCGRQPGSYGYEQQDADRFAQWEVDLLKYDYCFAPVNRHAAIERYTTMGKALQATGRPILYSICEWGVRSPWLWAKAAGGHLWRVAHDLMDQWDAPLNARQGIGILNALDEMAQIGAYSGPGGWNDPDMLIVGLRGGGAIPGGGCTDVEYRTHMTLWCLLAAPLILGCDLRDLDPATVVIIANPELIAINQDPLGCSGQRVVQRGAQEVWLKRLMAGQVAVALLNRGEMEGTIAVTPTELALDPAQSYQVRDVWTHQDLGELRETWTRVIPPHACDCFVMSPAD